MIPVAQTPSAQFVFDQTASTYDRQRALLIPGFNPFYQGVLDLLPDRVQHCIDLGAGTGLLAARVLEARPETKLTLVDSSEAMLAQARQRLAGVHKVEFVCGDYTEISLPTGADAVVSALSIHHLHAASKRTLFAQIAASLRPGGVFLNADQILGSTPAQERWLRENWLREVRELGAGETQIAESLFRQQADQCDTVMDQLLWMREHFVTVDCWYRQGRFAILYGLKQTIDAS